MVTHVVIWKMKPEAEGQDAAANMAKMQNLLYGLKGVVPGLLDLNCGVDFNRSAAAYDFALVTVHSSREALALYQDHPEHVKVRDFVGKVAQARAVVDF